MKCSLILTGLTFIHPFLLADENPLQPWSGYAIHDENRPHPEKVVGATVITTPAPKDAIILFNGKDTSMFEKPWPIINGSLIASKPGNLKSKQQFANCQVHLEWRIPANREIKGQKGGNSGLFLMGLYEIQIQESHTNITYADGQAGAIYGQFPPLKNASLPQGEWQSYDVIFTAPIYTEKGLESPATVTLIHNGIVIHNAQELKGPTRYKKVASYPKKHPTTAPIMLQWHQDPIEFRNFWVRELK